MYISLFLLFLLIGSTSTKGSGNFGIFTACIDNNNLRLECYYPGCQDSPPYTCVFMTSNGSLPANPSKLCKLCLLNHPVLYANKTMNYSCILTRRNRREEKQITIDYSILKGNQGHISPCSGTTGYLLHRSPPLLWPVVILSLWRVLGSQTT
ncbi:uncharacterized protein LOC114552215 isoform X2 [Perca flavescens]|uniref:uncharacterized protein LOC114552215 isoform X2 n=1 Tax=Perca flavescens TaxID=8167 RepID=UPI00106E16DA|nr:uncharacterized protein LOC114552215 isoform X2 [Perca flavescens]XP_028428662.1 uncharacterized protein LOC114552215 isoform X2 [Perca flavescens]